MAVATAHPKIPLRRAVGSSEPFALEPTSLTKVPDAPNKAAARPAAKLKAPPAPEKAHTDRSQLDSAEKALHKLDDARKGEESRPRREEDKLEQRKSTAQAAYVEARKTATAKIVAARAAYREAGGEG